MPKGFGGSSDFSGFFSGVYGYNKDNAKAQQSAADQDASDRWANGIMSDQEWLSYIDQRVTATSGDPKEHQRWITAQRKYSRVVADNVAESAYKEGGSINDLIGHYQNRMAGMTPDSNESRELSVRINDLQDQRAGEGLQDKADAMLINISKGTQTYGDLAKLLRDGIGASRENSDLKDSLEKQLKQVNEQIRSNKVEGAFEKLQYQYDAGSLSGAGYASALRRMAVQFKANDPQRYYQIMSAATKLSGGGGGGGGGGGYSSGGGGGGGGGSSSASTAKTIDALQAKRNEAYALIDAYERGATTYNGVHLTPAKIHELDLEVLKRHDQLAAAYTAKGDHSAAKNAEVSKAKYLTDTVVKHNTMPADEQSRVLLNTTTKRIESALKNPDPVRAMGEIRSIASEWEKFSANTAKYTKTVGNVQRSGKLEFDGAQKGDQIVNGDRKAVDKIDPGLTQSSAAFAGALRTISSETASDEEILAAIQSLEGVASSGYMKGSAMAAIATKALEIPARKQGLASGELIRVATAKGLEWVEQEDASYDTIGPDGRNVTTTQKMPKIPGVDGKSAKYIDIYMDINGQPTKVKAVAVLDQVQNLDGLQVQKQIKAAGMTINAGSFLTKTQIDKLGKAGYDVEKLLRSGQVEKAGVKPYWKVTTPPTTNKYGQTVPGETWSQDIETNLWYKGALPLRVTPTKDGLVDIDDDGNPAVGWRPYASAGGVAAVYAGSNNKEMQNLYNQGKVDVTGILGRDGLGNISEKPNNSPYWDASIANMADSSTRDSWWSDEERNRPAQDLRKVDELKASAAKAAGRINFGEGVEDRRESGLTQGIDMIAGIAKTFGINLNGTKTQDRAKLAQPGRMSGNAEMMAEKAVRRSIESKNAPKVELTLADEKKAMRTFSGPTVNGVNLDLPNKKKATAPTVKLSAAKKATPKPAAKPKPNTAAVKKVQALVAKAHVGSASKPLTAQQKIAQYG